MSGITSDDEKFYLDPSLHPDSRNTPKPADHDRVDLIKRTEALKKTIKQHNIPLRYFIDEPLPDILRILLALYGFERFTALTSEDEIEIVERCIDGYLAVNRPK